MTTVSPPGPPPTAARSRPRVRFRHPLGQLFLLRMRAYFREPAVIFWTYGFPIFLAIGLGIAFADGSAGIPGGSPTTQAPARPGSRYIDFLLPGLIGLNLMGGGLWGVGYVIVELRVRKLLKRLRATPMRRSDFLLSILGGRMVFLVPELVVLLLFGWLVFGTPIRGSLSALLVVVAVSGAAFASLGLLLACRAMHSETMSGLINAIMIPMWMFSGTFFPPERFPSFMQPLAKALPLTQVNDALRGVMLDGASLLTVMPQVLILASWGIASFVLALRWFRWQ